MLCRIVGAFCAACLMSGCGTQLPELVSQQVLPVGALISAIHCELKHAVREQAHKPDRAFLKTWQGAYTITLKGDETGTFAADANKFPVNLSGGSSVAIGAGADIKGTANRTAILKFSLNVADVRGDDRSCSEGTPTGTHPFLRGKIGFRDWLNTALDASLSDPTIRANPDKLTSIGHTFQFVVIANAGVNPVFTIVPRPITLNPSVSVSREEDNSVDVVLAKPAPKSSGPTIIVKVLTPGQLKKIADDTNARDEAQARLNKATAFLSSDDGRRLTNLQALISAKEASLTGLGVTIPKDIFGFNAEKGVPPERQQDAQTMREASSAIVSLQQLTGQLKNDKDYANFLNSRRDKEEMPAVIAGKQKSIEETRANPQGLRATASRGGVASVEENPNISNTSMQLTLERVLGNARVPGF